jgi:glycosyltransferase involved in cell wall biosynthesis
MINPMRTGSGLKNKVLEAFALERLVISNDMGMEALCAIKDRHYIQAEGPDQFAKEILKYSRLTAARRCIGQNARKLVLENYTWDKIGERYLNLIDSVLSS